MIKPQLYKENTYAFDAKYSHEFKYLWNENNNQSVKNRLIIRNNLTNVIVYQNTQETLLLKHILPANTLQNGQTYNAQIQAYDRSNNVSELSDAIIFKCYITPILSLNIVQEQVVRNSSYLFDVTFQQLEGEELQYYILELYDVNKSLMYRTSAKYSGTSTNITELIDNTTYYIKAIGQTINHMEVETDMIMFYVEYIKPAEYAYITVENRYNYGDIQFTSFLVSIEGRGINGEPIFNNGCVDTINGTSVIFDENFYLDNGQLLLKAKGLIDNARFLILKNDNNTMTFTLRQGTYKQNNDENKYYIELVCNDGNVYTVYHSNYMDYDANEFYNIKLKIVNNYIDLYFEGGA